MNESQQLRPDMTWGRALKVTLKSAPVILLALAVWDVANATRLHAFKGVGEFGLMAAVVTVVWHRGLKVIPLTLVTVLLLIVVALPLLNNWYPAGPQRQRTPAQAGSK